MEQHLSCFSPAEFVAEDRKDKLLAQISCYPHWNSALRQLQQEPIPQQPLKAFICYVSPAPSQPWTPLGQSNPTHYTVAIIFSFCSSILVCRSHCGETWSRYIQVESNINVNRFQNLCQSNEKKMIKTTSQERSSQGWPGLYHICMLISRSAAGKSWRPSLLSDCKVLGSI